MNAINMAREFDAPIYAQRARIEAEAEAASEAVNEAHCRLYAEFRLAAAEDVTRRIATPGWGANYSATTFDEVVNDDFAGEPGTESLRELLRIVARVAAAGDEQAERWMHAAAKRHADFHCDDAVDGNDE